jgi:predicted AAA+ superfamily ATPase
LGAAERGLLLTSYVDVVLLRDVIERHAVTNVTALRWLARRLLASPAGTFSVSSFANDLKSQGIHAGRDLLHQYLAYLADAFLLDTVPVATDSEKRRQVNPRKVYLVDTGLIPVYDRSGKANIGHALETAVFHALQAKGAEPAYVKTETGEEVDFLARFPDGGEALVQVCASIDDARTREREVRALLAASAGHPRARKLILTLESRVPFPETPEGIQVLPAWEWLTEC